MATSDAFAYGNKHLCASGTWKSSVIAKVMGTFNGIGWAQDGATVFPRGGLSGAAADALRLFCNVRVRVRGKAEHAFPTDDGEVPLAALRERGDVDAIVAKHKCVATSTGGRLDVEALTDDAANAVATDLLALSPLHIDTSSFSSEIGAAYI